VEIIALVLLGLFCYAMAKRDEKNLDNARSQAEAVTYGCGGMMFMLMTVVIGIAVFVMFVEANQSWLLPK
jgi:uncharacterized membrane protein